MEAMTAMFVGSASTIGAASGAAGIVAASGGTAGLFGFGGSIGAGGLLTSAISGFEFGLGDAFSIFGGLSDIASGNAAATGLELQAESMLVQSKSDELQGRLDALRITQDLNETLGTDIAQKFASGIRGEGSPTAAQEAAIKAAEFELETTRDAAAIRASSKRAQAAELKFSAAGEQSAGVAKAVRGVGLSLAKTKARG